jgi:hypothetical protein
MEIGCLCGQTHRRLSRCCRCKQAGGGAAYSCLSMSITNHQSGCRPATQRLMKLQCLINYGHGGHRHCQLVLLVRSRVRIGVCIVLYCFWTQIYVWKNCFRCLIDVHASVFPSLESYRICTRTWPDLSHMFPRSKVSNMDINHLMHVHQLWSFMRVIDP